MEVFQVFFRQWVLETLHPTDSIKLTLPADQAQADQEFHRKIVANETRNQLLAQTRDTLWFLYFFLSVEVANAAALSIIYTMK